MCFGRTPEQGNGGSTRISVYKHARYCHIISLHAVASQPIGHNSRFKVPHMVLPFHLATCTRTHVHTHTHQCIHCKVFKMRMHCGPPDRYASRITDMEMRSTSAAAAAPLSLSLSLPPSLPPSLPRVTVAQLSMLVDVFFWDSRGKCLAPDGRLSSSGPH